MRFLSRAEAGRALGREMATREWSDPLVLALPRGGVPVAEHVAYAIGARLDVIISRKIGAPFNPEMAIGAVGPDGDLVLDERLIRLMGVDGEYTEKESLVQVDEIRRRLSAYRGTRPPAEVTGKDTILVDDGIATGYTILAAARGLRRMRPSRLVIAVPICPPDTLDWLQREVDMVVSLAVPLDFAAVGQFYEDFGQVSDAEVIEILTRWWGEHN